MPPISITQERVFHYSMGRGGALEVILAIRKAGGMSPGQLQEELRMKASRVSQILTPLRDRGIIAHERNGQVVRYSIAPEYAMAVEQIVDRLAA